MTQAITRVIDSESTLGFTPLSWPEIMDDFRKLNEQIAETARTTETKHPQISKAQIERLVVSLEDSLRDKIADATQEELFSKEFWQELSAFVTTNAQTQVTAIMGGSNYPNLQRYTLSGYITY